MFILSIDGGGVRGVIPITILQRLNLIFPQLLSSVDLFAGTSTGAIIALGLAYGLTPEEAISLYLDEADDIFKDSIVDDILDSGNLVGAQYSNETLRLVLQAEFGDDKLGDLVPKVLISSFMIDNYKQPPFRRWKPKFYHNYDIFGDKHERIVDVACASSATPTYFPIYQGQIDGGVIANNPSMCALAQALHPYTGKAKLSDIRLLSLGTGHSPRYLKADKDDFGLIDWGPHLIDLMIDGDGGMVDYQCCQILNDNYHRVNPYLLHPYGLDEADDVDEMIEVAERIDLTDTIIWLSQFVNQD